MINQQDKSKQQQQVQLQKKNEQDEQQVQQQQQQQDDDSQSNQNAKWKKIQKPQKCINLFMIDFNQCDGKKCTGRKMQRFQMLKTLKDKDRKKKFKGIVLSAFGEKPISIQDLDICLKNGICVIDCSWNRIQQTNQFRFKNQRILPYVVAGNPVNYGKPFQLSCVQALATALCAINYVPQAQYIMSKFGWADGFWSINEKIKQYANCKNMDELQKKSQEIQQSQNTMKQRSYDISDSESNSDSNSESQQKEESDNDNIGENNKNENTKQEQKQVTLKQKNQLKKQNS